MIRPIDLRQATKDDVREGVVFYYDDGDDGPFWVTVEDVIRPDDEWKAFTADDGCRYGLDGAMVSDTQIASMKIPFSLSPSEQLLRESGMNSMQMYCWKPPKRYQQSFFVVAHTLEEAEDAVRKMIPTMEYKWSYEGWPEDYQLSIAPRGTVVLNDND